MVRRILIFMIVLEGKIVRRIKSLCDCFGSEKTLMTEYLLFINMVCRGGVSETRI